LLQQIDAVFDENDTVITFEAAVDRELADSWAVDKEGAALVCSAIVSTLMLMKPPLYLLTGSENVTLEFLGSYKSGVDLTGMLILGAELILCCN